MTQDIVIDIKRQLPFDFAVFDDYDNIVGLIEFQGRHHFEDNVYFGGGTHKDVILRDSIKKEYCSQNNIPLLLIPYWKLNEIGSIVINFLKDNYGKKHP